MCLQGRITWKDINKENILSKSKLITCWTPYYLVASINMILWVLWSPQSHWYANISIMSTITLVNIHIIIEYLQFNNKQYILEWLYSWEIEKLIFDCLCFPCSLWTWPIILDTKTNWVSKSIFSQYKCKLFVRISLVLIFQTMIFVEHEVSLLPLSLVFQFVFESVLRFTFCLPCWIYCSSNIKKSLPEILVSRHGS